MYKLRVALIVVLSGGVVAGAAALALRRSGDEDPQKGRVEFLVRSLGDPNPDVRRRSEEELRRLGPGALAALREASRSSDPRVAERALKLLREMEAAAESTSKPETGGPVVRPEVRETPEPRGVTVELAVSPDRGRPRFYVRITNRDAAPYLVARDRADGRIFYGRYARFELVDAEGRTLVVAAESPGDPAATKTEFIAVASGETLDLFAGQDDSRTAIGAALAPGTYRVRFLYDASEGSPYREAVQAADGAAPLPPRTLASAPVRIAVVN